ncbi:MAG TPA: hypothetical protein V6D22_06655 [Candidatus Obscuribacterales bacterium]
MRNLCKGLIIAATAVAACGFVIPKASAQTVIETTTTSYPSVIDYSLSNPVVLTEPAVIDTSPVVAPTIMTAPAVINTTPMWDWRSRGDMLHVGLPFFNLDLF